MQKTETGKPGTVPKSAGVALRILAGSVLYAASTVLLIFPQSLLLGGTSGISVILESFLPFSPGKILMGINIALIGLAFAVLGKNMAARTLAGSVLTTVCIGAFDAGFPQMQPLIANPYASAVLSGALIAVASGILFDVDSSSGGTDIVALIVQKYRHIQIGRALLLTDVLIVVIGGALSGRMVLICSFLGLLVKTLGIDAVIGIIRRRTGLAGRLFRR